MMTIIAYVPALHRGYIDFLSKSENIKIYLLDLDLVRKVPRLERDIRALTALEAQKALLGIGFTDVLVLSGNNLDEIKNADKILMPDEDVSRSFAKDYLKGRDVEYVSVFLRWDFHNSNRKNIVSPSYQISKNEFDIEVMRIASLEAEKSPDWWRQVGAILVKDGKIVITGFNRPLPSDQVHNIFGDPRSNFDYGIGFELSKFLHAEAGIIAEAAKRGVLLQGASLYVTTFPCPVCAKLIAAAGIQKVYYSEGYSLLDAEDVLKSFDVEIIKINDLGNSH